MKLNIIASKSVRDDRVIDRLVNNEIVLDDSIDLLAEYTDNTDTISMFKMKLSDANNELNHFLVAKLNGVVIAFYNESTTKLCIIGVGGYTQSSLYAELVSIDSMIDALISLNFSTNPSVLTWLSEFEKVCLTNYLTLFHNEDSNSSSKGNCNE